MPTEAELELAFRRAVLNVATLGDTDVFPLPPENYVLYDRVDATVAQLLAIHNNFDAWFRTPDVAAFASALSMVGYTSFRWVTQLDPLLNAYLLGLVLVVADELERARISRDDQVVFSYRYEYDVASHRLFAESAWREFNTRSLSLAAEHTHVLVCDIADFYSRIYHHRLENAVADAMDHPDLIPRRIIQVLTRISDDTSYGLPVGGPAARILSETLLDGVDQLLQMEGIVFCRFADDYHVFTDSEEAAHNALRFLTTTLQINQGLTLQRAKTRIITSKDFIASSIFADREVRDDSSEEDQNVPGDTLVASTGTLALSGAPFEHPERTFLSMSLRYDPYSPTAEEDYESLKAQVERFDITGMLARELAKSRIHTALTRRLLQALRFLDEPARAAAARSLIDNIEVLVPVFPNVMRALNDGFADLDAPTQEYICTATRQMIDERRYYVVVPVNLSYAIRLLANDRSVASRNLLAKMYEASPPFVRRDIILIMGRWRVQPWLTKQKATYRDMHPWSKRAFFMASYALGEAGRHWRRGVRGELPDFDGLVAEWMGQRANKRPLDIPL